MRQTLRAAAWACVFTVVVLSLIPRVDYPSTGMSGRFEHVIAYTGTAIFVGLSYLPQKSAWELIGWIVGLAGVLELLQHLAPGRHPGFGDFAASSSGTLIGMAIAVIACRWLYKGLAMTDA